MVINKGDIFYRHLRDDLCIIRYIDKKVAVYSVSEKNVTEAFAKTASPLNVNWDFGQKEIGNSRLHFYINLGEWIKVYPTSPLEIQWE